MVASWHPLPVTGAPNLSGFVVPTARNLVQVDFTLDEAFLVFGFVSVWNQNYQDCSDVSMKVEEEHRDRHESFGYGSISINTIFRGVNIHKSQLFWCEQKGYYWFWHTATWIICLCWKDPMSWPYPFPDWLNLRCSMLRHVAETCAVWPTEQGGREPKERWDWWDSVKTRSHTLATGGASRLAGLQINNNT